MSTALQNPKSTDDNKKVNFKPTKRVVIVISSVIAFLAIAFTTLILTLPSDTIANGVYIEDINLSGLTLAEAQEKIGQKHFYEEKTITITNNSKSQSMTSADINLVADINATAKKAFDVCKSKNKLSDSLYSLKLRFFNTHLMAVPKINTQKLDGLIYTFGISVNGELKEHQIQINDDTATITPGKTGQSTNVEAARNTILQSVEQEKFDNIQIHLSTEKPKHFDVDSLYNAIYKAPQNAMYSVSDNIAKVVPHVVGVEIDKSIAKNQIDKIKEGANPITFPIKKTLPSITTNMLTEKLFNSTLYTYTTSYNPSKTNRSDNLALACKKINGTVLAPGDVFSYNDVVGKRTLANGFKNAPVYENGKSVDGIGGGVCQVSTTLYSAVLYADLQVVSRTNHSLPVAYVPLGQDATVADGYIDFKFKNNTDYPVKIISSAKGGTILVSLVGTEPDTKKVVKLSHETIQTIEPTINETNDPTLPAGTKKITSQGKRGYTISSTKSVYENDVITSTKSLGNSVYKMIPTEVSVGLSKTSTPEIEDSISVNAN